MAKVEWPTDALEQLSAIVTYIRLFDRVAADRIGSRLLACGNSLSTFPLRGRPAAGGTREMVTVRPYVLRYRVVGEQVVILSIRHAAQLPQDD